MVTNHDLSTTNSRRGAIYNCISGVRKSGRGLHLRFYVASDQEFALPAMAIRGVNVRSSRPNYSDSRPFSGTLNLRGRVIWVTDLGQFLEKPTALNIERSEIPVIAVEDQDTMVGLAVDTMSEWNG